MPQLTSFKPTLYVLLLIGVAAFSVASESAGLLLLGVGGIVVNAWLVKTGRFRPLPRIAANLVVIAALLYIARELLSGAMDQAVLKVGQFLVLLQLVKLWEQRQNRDYGQLLVLSLLLMVAATIHTTSVVFGLLMVVYMLLALYASLLFHLKVETDRAVEEGRARPQPSPSVQTARRNRRSLNRSMRRLTGVVSVAGIVGAILVFLFFPRGSGASGPTPFGRGPRSGKTETGLANQIDYKRQTRIYESTEIVAHVQASQNGRWMGVGDVLYLRQTALDRYRRRPLGGQWVRESFVDSELSQISRESRFIVDYTRDVAAIWPIPGTPTVENSEDPALGVNAPKFKQRIVLGPTKQSELLAVGGVLSVIPTRDMWFKIGSDGTLQSKEPVNTQVEYTVESTGTVPVSERDLPLSAVSSQRNVARAGRTALERDRETEEFHEAVAIDVSPKWEGSGPERFFREGGRRFRGWGAVDSDGRPFMPPMAPLRDWEPWPNDFVYEIDGRPLSTMPIDRRRDAVNDALAKGLQLTILRSGVRRVLNSVAEPTVRGANEGGVRIGGRLWCPPLLRAFGPREGDPVVAVDGVPIKELPPAERVPATIAALRSGKPVTVEVFGNRTVTYPAVPPEIEEYARNPEVSGTDDQGRSLAAMRDRLKGTPDVLDVEIARAIESHLRTKFTYTLDLSDAEMDEGVDHLVWFLSKKGQRGHCTYFAGAMALMCQTLGLNARVAVGVRCDEFNPFSQEFVVRGSHAHAWVEVLTTKGWERFDPTSSRGADGPMADYGLMQQLRHLFDWMESTWAKNVLYYNNDSRDNLINSVEMQMTKPLYQGVNEGWITRNFTDSKLYQKLTTDWAAFSKGAGVVVGVLILIVTAWRYWRKWTLRQVAERVGLQNLPAEQRRRMAEQLIFYDELLKLLERRKLVRRPSQTPMEFARSLLTLPADAYEMVHRLTEIFYRIRFGEQTLSPAAQRRLSRVVEQLAQRVTTE